MNRALIWAVSPDHPGSSCATRSATLVLGGGDIGGERLPSAPARVSEFMPSLNEGTLLYMPTTLPGISITKAGDLLQTQDRIIKSFPEVASVYGKAGRAETATDPAPTEMFETVVNLKPKEEWPAGMTIERPAGRDLDKALQFPGVSNAWTMPIKARTDMLATGIRTPVGIKVLGKDLARNGKGRTPASRRSFARWPGTSRALTRSGLSAATTSRSFPTVTRSRATA